MWSYSGRNMVIPMLLRHQGGAPMAQARPRTATTRRTKQPMTPLPTMPLTSTIEDYLAEAVERSLKPNTIAHQRRSLRHLSACMPAGTCWDTAAGVRAAVAALRARSYRDTSMNMFLRVWQTFLRFCHAEGICKKNLAQHITTPKAEPRRAFPH